MQQQPEKLIWRGQSRKGLSASQFGMALGFCGRISDYVTYCRDIAGTEQAFKGNVATEHGCRTESKARACYELITGHKVLNGGFFTLPDRVLACSPDGIVSVVKDCEGSIVPWNVTEEIKESDGVNFEAARPQSYSPLTKAPFRLLEIKSPMWSLYDGSKSGYQPHGIPLHYMCQMQGQMAIACAEECDFFVFLDRPSECEVMAWRVKRSESFWTWCEPKLRLVSSWIEDGLPEGVDRSFRFDRFDFGSLDVEPLVAPFSVTKQRHILDLKKFKFFNDYYRYSAKRVETPPTLQISNQTTQSAQTSINSVHHAAACAALSIYEEADSRTPNISPKLPTNSRDNGIATWSGNYSSRVLVDWPLNPPLLWPAAKILFGGAKNYLKSNEVVLLKDEDTVELLRTVEVDWEGSTATFSHKVSNEVGAEGAIPPPFTVGFDDQSFWKKIRRETAVEVNTTNSPTTMDQVPSPEDSNSSVAGMLAPSFSTYMTAYSLSKDLEERYGVTNACESECEVSLRANSKPPSEDHELSRKVYVAETVPIETSRTQPPNDGRPMLGYNGSVGSTLGQNRRVSMRTLMPSELYADGNNDSSSPIFAPSPTVPSPQLMENSDIFQSESSGFLIGVPSSTEEVKEIRGAELDSSLKWLPQFQNRMQASIMVYFITNLSQPPVLVATIPFTSNARSSAASTSPTSSVVKLFCFPTQLLMHLVGERCSPSVGSPLAGDSLGGYSSISLGQSKGSAIHLDSDDGDSSPNSSCNSPQNSGLEVTHPEIEALRTYLLSSPLKREVSERKAKFSILPKRLSGSLLLARSSSCCADSSLSPTSSIATDNPTGKQSSVILQSESSSPMFNHSLVGSNFGDPLILSVGLLTPKAECLRTKCGWVKTIWSTFVRRIKRFNDNPYAEISPSNLE